MKNKIVKSFIVSALMLSVNFCVAQTESSSQLKNILTADSLSSGNVKDILTGFFQLAFDNLIGDNKELNFSSNPYAVMLKADSTLALDKYYYKYRALRKTNFSFGLKLDTSYHFNGFSSAIKYAIIDKRDSTTSALLFNNLMRNEFAKEADSLQELLKNYILTLNNFDSLKKYRNITDDFFNKNIPFNNLDSSFQNKVKEIVDADKNYFKIIIQKIETDPSFNVSAEGNKEYDSLKGLIKNDLLWTASVSDTTYKDQFFFSNILFSTEIVKGLGSYKPGSNIEFDLKAGLNLLDDSSIEKRNLKRSIFNFEPGFNFVFRNKNNDQSLAEFQLSGSYYHVLSNLYNNERKDSLTLDATLRIRIINDIWIPLEIKYDPKSGNVFGFLNVHFNFKSLGDLLKSSKPNS